MIAGIVRKIDRFTHILFILCGGCFHSINSNYWKSLIRQMTVSVEWILHFLSLCHDLTCLSLHSQIKSYILCALVVVQMRRPSTVIGNTVGFFFLILSMNAKRGTKQQQQKKTRQTAYGVYTRSQTTSYIFTIIIIIINSFVL